MNLLKRLSVLKNRAFVSRQSGLRASVLGATLVGALFSGSVSAALVSYTFNGSFKASQTLGGFENAQLVDSVAPVLGVGSSLTPKTFSVTVSLDTAATGVPSSTPGTQIYRTVVSSSSNFAGFSSTDQSCVGATGDFICTAQVFNGTGVFGSGSDSFALLPSLGRSIDFEAATGETRRLDFQFVLFFLDSSGNALTSNSVDVDLSLLDVTKFSGSFVVNAPTIGAPGFDRADFDLQIDSVRIGSAPSSDVPEPGSLFLTALACLALGLSARKRTHQPALA